MHSKWDALRGNIGFFVTMAGCLLAVAVCGYFLLLDDDPPPAAAPVPQAESTVSAPEPKPQMPETAQEDFRPVMVPSETISVPAETFQPDDTPVIAEAPRLIVAPLEGDVITAFSVDALLYNPTLEDWRIHDGMDISAPLGTGVLAAGAGTVIAVENDPMMGTSITLSHEDGYLTTYANLQPEVSVRAGDAVSAGQLIGAVGDTAAAEAAQPPHLHFSVFHHGDVVDPEEFLNS